MKNITVAISDTVYHEARVWAAHHDTSVSSVVQYLLQHFHRIPPWIHRDLQANVPLPRYKKDMKDTVLSEKSPVVAIHPKPEPAPNKEVPSEKPLPIADFEL